MSNYFSKAKRKKEDKYETVEMLDDFYGKHEYAVRFANGDTYREEDVIVKGLKNKPTKEVEKLQCGVCGAVGRPDLIEDGVCHKPTKEMKPCDCPKGGMYSDGTICEKCGGSEWVENKPTKEYCKKHQACLLVQVLNEDTGVVEKRCALCDMDVKQPTKECKHDCFND